MVHRIYVCKQFLNLNNQIANKEIHNKLRDISPKNVYKIVNHHLLSNKNVLIRTIIKCQFIGRNFVYMALMGHMKK